MIKSWKDMAKLLRCSPAAVARQLITQLESHKTLTSSEERRIIHAIESANVPNGVNRMLASLSRGALNELLNKI